MSFTRTLKNDLHFGKKCEQKILPVITKFFNDEIEMSKNQYSTYDFIGKKYIYELKSRTNKYLDFDTTLIPEKKILNRKNDNIIFLFYFTDGLYYIKFDKKKFNIYKKDLFCRNARIDYNDMPSLYYYIPVTDLKKIDM